MADEAWASMVVRRWRGGVMAGHWGMPGYDVAVDGSPRSPSGFSPEEILGRSLADGTKLIVMVSVVEEKPWPPQKNPWHEPMDGATLPRTIFECKDCMEETFTKAWLEAQPVIVTAQADDLRFDGELMQVWLSRCGVEDGEPFPDKVTVLVRAGRSKPWLPFHEWQARP